MRYLVFLFLVKCILAKIPIAVITTTGEERYINLVTSFCQSSDIYLLKVSKIINDKDEDEVKAAYSEFNTNKVRDVFAYLPNINPELLNSITSSYKIYTLNAVSNEIQTCMKYTFSLFGFTIILFMKYC